MDIKTKYDIGEFLYTMHENKIVYGRVTNININVSVYENRHKEEYTINVNPINTSFSDKEPYNIKRDKFDSYKTKQELIEKL